jgi:Fe-S cluster biogenesis protein NfuA
VRELGRLECTPAATRVARRLPRGEAIHLSGVQRGGAWHFEVRQGVTETPLDPTRGVPVLGAADVHAAACRLRLDHDGDWTLSAQLEVRPRATPNPASRTYETDRLLCQGGRTFERGSARGSLSSRLLALDGVCSVLLREGTATLVWSSPVDGEGVDAQVIDTVRTWLLEGGQPESAHADPTDQGELAAEVWAFIQSKILPGIHRDGGDLDLLAVEAGVVRVRMTGACDGCPAASLTLEGGIRRTLMQAFPGRITDVVAEDT